MATEHDSDADADADLNNPFKMLFRTAPAASGSLEASEPSAEASTPVEQTHHIPSINSSIITRQLPSQGLSFQLWPAATALVSLLDRFRSNPNTPLSSLFTGRRPLRILELGSGTGLAGIAAAAIFGANVTLTDLPHVLPNLNSNIEANSPVLEANSCVVNAKTLCWGDIDQLETFGRDYDLILGSDLVYHDHLYDPLLKTMKFFLIGNGNDDEKREIVFLMAHLRRWKKESLFFKKAKKMFDVEIVHKDTPPQGTRVGVVVYKFMPPKVLSIKKLNIA